MSLSLEFLKIVAEQFSDDNLSEYYHECGMYQYKCQEKSKCSLLESNSIFLHIFIYNRRLTWN